MDEGNALALFFLQIWRLFTLDSPFFGLKMYHIFFGLFIAELGVPILGQAFLGLLDTSSPSEESRIDDYNRRAARSRAYLYNRYGIRNRR